MSTVPRTRFGAPCSAIAIIARPICSGVVTAEGISRNSVFQDSEIFASFPLASRLDAQGGVATS